VLQPPQQPRADPPTTQSPPAQPQPFVVQIIEPSSTHQTSLKDVFVGAFGLTGLLVCLALATGALLAVVFVHWRRRHPPEADHLPPVA
jgi:hypothetical protein